MSSSSGSRCAFDARRRRRWRVALAGSCGTPPFSCRRGCWRTRACCSRRAAAPRGFSRSAPGSAWLGSQSREHCPTPASQCPTTTRLCCGTWGSRYGSTLPAPRPPRPPPRWSIFATFARWTWPPCPTSRPPARSAATRACSEASTSSSAPTSSTTTRTRGSRRCCAPCSAPRRTDPPTPTRALSLSSRTGGRGRPTLSPASAPPASGAGSSESGETV
mmetsp:Transcript_41865/g.136572  ORF Transcript_41865/g.136572 Transcript_41865/m.136572 type:complete len:218 (+) Transcript_41865:262-915(+)